MYSVHKVVIYEVRRNRFDTVSEFSTESEADKIANILNQQEMKHKEEIQAIKEQTPA